MSEKQPEKKVGFFAKAKKSSKASLNELKKVHWPTCCIGNGCCCRCSNLGCGFYCR